MVLSLDAGNTKSYPGTGTTWANLSSDQSNSTLFHSPTFINNNTGGIVLNGNNQYVDTLVNSTPTSVTLEVIFSVSSNTFTKTGGNTVAQYIVFRQNSRTINFEGVALIYIVSSPTGYISAYMSSSSGIGRGANSSLINFNQIYTISAVYTPTNVSIYVDGNFVTQTATGFAIDYNATHTYKIGRAAAIGTAYDGYLNGTIYNVKIYNRALSSAEVLQNYNATKTRFI